MEPMRIAFADDAVVEGPVYRPAEMPRTLSLLRLDFDESSS